MTNDEQIKQWQNNIGKPLQTITRENCTIGFWKFKCPGHVFVARIDKQNCPDITTVQIYTKEFIDKLIKTRED